MTVTPRRLWPACLACACALLMAACASNKPPAPTEERALGSRSSASRAAAAAEAARAASATGGPAATPDSRPTGTYVVKPGDTLMRIGLETGQGWRDLARWNNIDNPNVIEVGQTLIVLPPAGEASVVSVAPVASPKLDSKPLASRPASAGSAASTPSAAASSGPVLATAAPAAQVASAVPTGTLPPRDGPDDDVQWAWPAAGTVVTAFDENRSKGLAIAGKAGDPVLAAADGRVVYAGSGLRGYGNLVIVKHNATFLTAYAHNQTLLVKEDQAVRRGQKIAEMGSTDADKVQLHFEIRKLGKPIDPAKLLPPR